MAVSNDCVVHSIPGIPEAPGLGIGKIELAVNFDQAVLELRKINQNILRLLSSLELLTEMLRGRL